MVHGLEDLKRINDEAVYRATGSKTGEGFFGQHSREQWLMAMQISAIVMAVNAPFCDGGPAEKRDWLEPVADLVAASTSPMAIEDLILILEMSLAKIKERSEKGQARSNNTREA